jgi:hypothetical protein
MHTKNQSRYLLLSVATSYLSQFCAMANTSVVSVNNSSVKIKKINDNTKKKAPQQLSKSFDDQEKKAGDDQEKKIGIEPALRISGFSLLSATVGSQKFNNAKGTNPLFAVGASNLKFNVQGLSYNRIKYGYILILNAFSHDGEKPTVDQNYLDISRDDLGTVHFGNVSGAEERLPVDLNSRMGGPGGILAYEGFYNLSAGAVDFTTLSVESNKSTKFSYYTPRFGGFQLAFSFTPSTSHLGREGKNTDAHNFSGLENNKSIYCDNDKAPIGQNHFAGGLGYKATYGHWTYEAALVGILSKYRLPKALGEGYHLKNGKAYHVSLAVLHKNFGVAGGYFDNMKSKLPTRQEAILPDNKGGPGKDAHKGDAGKGWNIGCLYAHNHHEFFLNYNQSSRNINGKDKAKFNMLNFAYEYPILPGLRVMAEIGTIRSTTASSILDARKVYDTETGKKRAVPNNRAKYAIVAAKVSF